MDRRSTAVQFVPQFQPRETVADEIDLVDLAVVLVRRWRVMAAVFIAVVSLGAAAAWMKEASYEYRAVVTLGQQADGMPLVSPEAVQAAIRNVVLPAVAASANNDSLRDLTSGVRLEAPKGSDVVVMSVTAAEGQAADVEQLVARVREQLLAEQNERFERAVGILRTQAAEREAAVAAFENAIAKLQAELPAADRGARALLLDQIARLQESRLTAQQDLARLRGDIARVSPTRVSDEPSRSLSPSGTSASLILALAVVLAVMLAVFAAFFAEFGARVKARLRDE